MKTTDILAAALSYAARGWMVFPAPPNAKKSYKSEQYSGAKWGMTRDPAQIRRDWEKWPDANVGLPTGSVSGFWVSEADTMKGHGVDGIAALRALEEEHGNLPPTLMAESPSGSVHYYWQLPVGIEITNSASMVALGVDVKGEGGMVIAPPSVRKDGTYRWLNERPIAAAPNWLVQLATSASRQRKARSNGARATNLEADEVEQLADALDALPNDNLDWENWNRIGMAIYAATGGSSIGLGLFHTWSMKSSKYDSDATEDKWAVYHGCPPTDIGAGTIFFLAGEAGWRGQQQDAGQDTKKPETSAGLGVLDAGDDAELEHPPPRGWLLGNIFARKFLGSLLAEGGTGKTALRYAQLLSLASGRSLTGDYVFQRCRVLIISLEDDIDELRRRVLAVMRHYGIARADLRGWLFYVAPGAAGGKLMSVGRYGRLMRGTLAANLEADVVKYKPDLVAIDPFVKSHAIPENDNTGIDMVAQLLTDMAAKYDFAVDSPHHTAKGAPDPGNASRGRGASAMKDAGRLVYTLSTMTAEEAELFDIPEEERHAYIRMDKGKVNILPPSRKARWFKLVGVKLDNATAMYPSGDEVQTVEPWQPPDRAWADLDADLQRRILAAIDAGLSDGNRYTEAARATERAAWRVVVQQAPSKSETQAREVIKTWVDSGVLVSREYPQPVTYKKVKGLWVDWAKAPAQKPHPGDDELPF